MQKISSLNFLKLIFYYITITVYLSCQGSSPNKRDMKIMELVRMQDTSIFFYGKVIDDCAKPVEEATVSLHFYRFNPINFIGLFEDVIPMKLKTDKDGNFSIQGVRGSSIFVDDISKPNFDNRDFLKNRFNRDFNFGKKDLTRPLFIATPQNPVIYILRKKGPDAFLMKKGWTGFRFTPAESGTSKGQDFSRNDPEFPMQAGANFRPTVYGQPVTCDLRAKATLDARSGEWTIELAPGHPDGGILASNELLYEAPATGYQSALVFKAQGRGPKDGNDRGDVKTPLPAKYLYVRSRGYQTVYSRVELDEAIRVEWGPSPKDRTTTELTCTLSAGPTYMNPYGERNLEEATELPWPVLRDIRNQAEEALHRGQRPTAPDLQERVAAWERSRPLTDKVKDWFK